MLLSKLLELKRVHFTTCKLYLKTPDLKIITYTCQSFLEQGKGITSWQLLSTPHPPLQVELSQSSQVWGSVVPAGSASFWRGFRHSPFIHSTVFIEHFLGCRLGDEALQKWLWIKIQLLPMRSPQEWRMAEKWRNSSQMGTMELPGEASILIAENREASERKPIWVCWQGGQWAWGHPSRECTPAAAQRREKEGHISTSGRSSGWAGALRPGNGYAVVISGWVFSFSSFPPAVWEPPLKKYVTWRRVNCCNCGALERF